MVRIRAKSELNGLITTQERNSACWLLETPRQKKKRQEEESHIINAIIYLCLLEIGNHGLLNYYTANYSTPML